MRRGLMVAQCLVWAHLLLGGGCEKEPRVAQSREGRASAERHADVPAVEWSVEFSGSGLGRPTTLSYQELARMEMTRLENILQQKSHSPDEVTSWEGVPLETLFLEVAEMKPGPMVLTMEAADGYRVMCSLDDMESAIIALKDGEGRWLAEVGKRFPLRVVPPRMMGNYWVVNLRRVNVEPADDSS